MQKPWEEAQQKLKPWEQARLKSPSELQQALTPEIVKKAASKISPYVPAALGTAVGVGASFLAPASAPTWLPGLISSGTMASIQNLLEPKSQNVGKDIAVDTTINEVGGRLISGMTKVGGLIAGGVLAKIMPSLANKFKLSTINESFLKLKPTAAQLTDSKILNLIENNLNPFLKRQALLRSGKMTEQEAESLLQQLTGRTTIKLNTPYKQGSNIELGLQEQFDASLIESNIRGIKTKLIATQNSKQIPIYKEVPSTIMPGQMIIQKVGDELVEGPIIPTKLIQNAQQLLDEVTKVSSKPASNNDLIQILQALIKDNQTLDVIGNTIPKSRSFKDLWDEKKNLNELAYPRYKTDASFKDARLAKLARAIDDDITNSIPLWDNPQNTAKLFAESKLIAAKRHELFDKGPIEVLVDKETKSIPALDSLIHTPKELYKAIIAGHLQIPDGQGFKYITNNTRKDLAGYEMQQLFNRAQITDKQGNKFYDGQKILDEFLDNRNYESYRALWNSKDRSNYEQFFKNIIRTQEKTDPKMSNYLMLRLGASGLSLGSGIVTGMVSGSLPTGAITGGLIAGGVLSGAQINKLLTNPASARLMVSLAQNGPLNMSNQAAGRIIAHVLRNSNLNLQNQDGSTIEGKLNAEGKFVIPLNSGEK